MRVQAYCHCRLQRRTPKGFAVTYHYLPEPYGVVGKMLKLRNAAGEWEQGWEVVRADEQGIRSEIVNVGKLDMSRVMGMQTS